MSQLEVLYFDHSCLWLLAGIPARILIPLRTIWFVVLGDLISLLF
jgi:hypothetical protein